MDESAISSRLREIIATATGRAPQEITDTVEFIDDLGLDSLVLLEIGVDIEYEFELKLPDMEENLKGVTNLRQAVALVQRHLNENSASLKKA